MAKGADMDRLIAGLEVAPQRLMDAAADATAASLRASADRGYQRRQDVNGRRYPRPKDGHMPPMERTGTLRSSYQTDIAPHGDDRTVTLREGTDYGQFLRDGTSKMEPRKHIPAPADNMPPTWDQGARRAQDRAVAQEGRRVWTR